MKTLTRSMLAAIAVSLCALAVNAQATAADVQVADAWVAVSPEGEEFSARMPEQPIALAQQIQLGELRVSGQRYAAAVDEQTTFIVWSLKDSNDIRKRPRDG